MKNRLTQGLLLYIIAGLIFATFYDIYYKWGLSGFLSPGFFFVTATWPFQLLGFVKDLRYFGPTGKPL